MSVVQLRFEQDGWMEGRINSLVTSSLLELLIAAKNDEICSICDEYSGLHNLISLVMIDILVKVCLLCLTSDCQQGK